MTWPEAVAHAPPAPPAPPAPAPSARSSRARAWLAPGGLFLLALVVRLLVLPLVDTAPNEGSAYYVGVAANLVTGPGLVSDAVWSYATPPHTVPKPAFELWLPMATFVAALPMSLLGPTLTAAQLGMATLGAMVAPLAWLIGRDAARVAGRDERRVRAVALTSGLVAAVLGPFVVATAGPDSTTPFLVFGTLAAVLMPRALAAATAPPGRRRWGPGLGLGIALGCAWLSRQEAIWLGATYLLLLVVAWRSLRVGRGDATAGASGSPGRPTIGWLATALVPVVIGGLIMVVPWLLRTADAFGSPFAGQAVENLWLRANEDIFAWRDRPSAAAYLGQGAGVVLGDRVAAIGHQLVSVLILPAFPIGLTGLIAVVGLRRSPALRRPTALLALLVSGGATFLATALLFPVATQWGTFLHAAGPLLVGLVVTTSLGADGLMARISARRGWPAVNVLIPPIALLALALPLLALQLLTVARQADQLETRLAAVAADVARLVPGDRRDPPVIVTDHPMWLANATGWRAIALPDEAPEVVADLARAFRGEWLVVMDQRGRYPGALLEAQTHRCLAAEPVRIGPEADPAWLFRLDLDCAVS